MQIAFLYFLLSDLYFGEMTVLEVEAKVLGKHSTTETFTFWTNY